MKKIILILIIFNLFYINKVKAEEKEYVYIVSLSDKMVARDMENNINAGENGGS